MTVVEQSAHAPHRTIQSATAARSEILLTMLLFGSMDAITWAIRFRP